jgi:hypothetical protein
MTSLTGFLRRRPVEAGLFGAAALLLCSLPSPAMAQAPTPAQLTTPAPGPKTPDNLFVSGQTPIGGDSTSRGAGVEWLHPMNATTALQAGGFMGKSAGGWFTYGRLGGMLRHASLTYAGAVDLGGGREGGNGFSYTRARGEVTIPSGLPQFLTQGEVDHIRVAGNVVTGLRAGGVYQVTPRLSTRANFHAYVGGGDVSPAGSVRADYGTAEWRVLGGVFFSKKPTLASNAVDLTPSMHATRTTFVGMQVRAGAQDLVGVVDVSEQPSGSVTTLMLSVKVPLQ